MLQADPETPAQSWKTDGIAAMEPPGAVARLFMAIVAFVERLNLKLAKLGNPCVHDPAAFPWAAGVEREWRVIRERRHWQEGRALIFDDAYEHEAWNDTGGLRVVLFVDFEKPLRFPASVLNRLLLRLAVFTPFVRESGDNLRRWEQRFHGAATRGPRA